MNLLLATTHNQPKQRNHAKKNMNVSFNKDTSTHIDGRQLIPNPFKAIQTKNQFTSQVAKPRADKYKQFSKAGNSQSCGITLIVTILPTKQLKQQRDNSLC
jgi:hypothetical protein